ncbi:conserved hypothetical protein [Desulfotalea psychrophila LSv54]|uniref:Uncharacterized protein n=1 Tax=Desulfotalea psychrophila (strain LSv54 / DSM 12343) TaxID=177439 RepID=Q6AQL3_DESPS|nr:conserved hypothetical protein [Desulfotalea psychrophila LSv54]
MSLAPRKNTSAWAEKHSKELQKEIHKRQTSEEELNYKVNFDSTTRLPNKTMAYAILCEKIAEAQKTNQRLYVLSVDLANFKKVNKGLGHDGGEHLLEIAAERIVRASGPNSTVARLRGDEFLVSNFEDSETSSLAESTAKNILEELQKPFFIQQIDFYLGACIGVSLYPRDSSKADKLMRYADLAMYRAKEKGQNIFCFYSQSLSHIISRKQMLEQHLHKAISRDELTLYYQPFIKLGKELKIVGAEALLRWNNKTFEDITATELIAVAEETGLIVPIGEWVLQKATADIASINPPRSFRIALNLSAQQFHNPNQLQTAILTALRESGLQPDQLELEITENNLLNLGAKTIHLLQWIKQLGIRLSIDDFGTGYSSLHYLQKQNFDLLKIDKSFIKDIHLKKSNRVLVDAIFAMSKTLGIEVIAEGIESKAEEEFLRQQNYGLAQGFRYSRPVPLEPFKILLDQQKERGYVRFPSSKDAP